MSESWDTLLDGRSFSLPKVMCCAFFGCVWLQQCLRAFGWLAEFGAPASRNETRNPKPELSGVFQEPGVVLRVAQGVGHLVDSDRGALRALVFAIGAHLMV